MSKKGRITGDLDKFRRIVADSKSFREVIEAYDYKESGGVYSYLKSVMKKYNIDHSHFLGQGWSKGKTRDDDERIEKTSKQIEWSDKEVFKKGTRIKGQNLVKRLLRSSKKEYKCEECNRKTWKGNPITLIPHHINEDSSDNRIENIELLCPNCHYILRHEYGKENWKYCPSGGTR